MESLDRATTLSGDFYLENLMIKHGKSNTKIYKVWSSLKNRCKSKTCKSYKNYGGRGIKVCNRWEKFENFYADMGDNPGNLTIERINNDKGYSPGNCKWATREEQSNNKRDVKLLSFNGELKSLCQWAKKIKMPWTTLYFRVNKWKWPLEKALTIPIKTKFRHHAPNLNSIPVIIP